MRAQYGGCRYCTSSVLSCEGNPVFLRIRCGIELQSFHPKIRNIAESFQVRKGVLRGKRIGVWEHAAEGPPKSSSFFLHFFLDESRKKCCVCTPKYKKRKDETGLLNHILGNKLPVGAGRPDCHRSRHRSLARNDSNFLVHRCISMRRSFDFATLRSG